MDVDRSIPQCAVLHPRRTTRRFVNSIKCQFTMYIFHVIKLKTVPVPSHRELGRKESSVVLPKVRVGILPKKSDPKQRCMPPSSRPRSCGTSSFAIHTRVTRQPVVYWTCNILSFCCCSCCSCSRRRSCSSCSRWACNSAALRCLVRIKLLM